MKASTEALAHAVCVSRAHCENERELNNRLKITATGGYVIALYKPGQVKLIKCIPSNTSSRQRPIRIALYYMELPTFQQDHIVSLLKYGLGSAAWLHLEYMPEGSSQNHLDANCSFSDYERKKIFEDVGRPRLPTHARSADRAQRRQARQQSGQVPPPSGIYVNWADFCWSRGKTL
jgi:hypothetical protein